MKYIITESQFKLISEIERDWRSSDYAEEYGELKGKMINYFIKMFSSYSKDDNRITLYDSDGNPLLVFNKLSGELYYNRDLDETYSNLLPHPTWLVHGKFIMSDVFEKLFPKLSVSSVKSANM